MAYGKHHALKLGHDKASALAYMAFAANLSSDRTIYASAAEFWAGMDSMATIPTNFGLTM